MGEQKLVLKLNALCIVNGVGYLISVLPQLKMDKPHFEFI